MYVFECVFVQEKTGYFFCLEDRALLCRQCDVSIHTASPCVSSHQRFLMTGVKVALQPSTVNDNINSNSSSSNGGNYHWNSPASNASSAEPPAGKKCRMVMKTDVTTSAAIPITLSGEPHMVVRPNWSLDEILRNADFDHCYGLSDLGSSRNGRY